jgi:hypothetical protein
VADTLVNVPPVALYPAQFVLVLRVMRWFGAPWRTIECAPAVAG